MDSVATEPETVHGIAAGGGKMTMGIALLAAAPAHAATVAAIAQVDHTAVVRFNSGDCAIPGVDGTDGLSAPIPGVSIALAFGIA